MDRPTDKWFTMDKKELTLENAKEFFFDFKCNYHWMDTRLNDFWKLNITKETIINWSTDYYLEDIKKYDILSHKEKIFYMRDLSSMINQFDQNLAMIILSKFQELIDQKDIYKINFAATSIAKCMIRYHAQLDDKFYGFIPKTLALNNQQLLTSFCEKLVDIIFSYSDKFDGSFDRKYYYESLMLFNDTHLLGYKDLIEKLK